MNKLGILLVGVFIGLTQAIAAVPARPLRIVKDKGAFFGGQAGEGFSLLDVKTAQPNVKTERIFLVVGDLQERPHKGLPGYYHIEMRDQKIIIDFPQMPQAKITAQQLQKNLAKSKFVANAVMNVDASDGGLNMVLTLKRPAKLNVLQVPGQKMSSQVVLQLFE